MTSKFDYYELEAFLGEFKDEYDVESIIHDATYVDAGDGNRYWRDGIGESELFEICETHSL